MTDKEAAYMLMDILGDQTMGLKWYTTAKEAFDKAIDRLLHPPKNSTKMRFISLHEVKKWGDGDTELKEIWINPEYILKMEKCTNDSPVNTYMVFKEELSWRTLSISESIEEIQSKL